MNPPVTLRGMAWDHPRARGPLEAISVEWSEDTGATIEWDARPLRDFEDQPLEDLATKYDLVLIDYPFVGTAATSGLIVPVDEWVDAAYLADQAAHSAGASFSSYEWAGKQWALAIDAACQVSAVRDDLWSAAKAGSLPGTWAEVADLARRFREAPNQVAMPLNPNHAYCAFLSHGVSLAGNRFWPTGACVDRDAALESLEFLRQIATQLHPASRTADPIAISDRMANSDEIVYVPLMFGYSNYARPGFRTHRLSFGNAPRGDGGRPGSVLGGVGLALSARCTHRAAAAELARRIAAPATQCGIYASAGGQPGHAAAWGSPGVNAQTDGFFVATRDTMECAFMRPRVPGHRRFQQLAGDTIHRFIWAKDTSAAECLSAYEDLAVRWLSDWRPRVSRHECRGNIDD